MPRPARTEIRIDEHGSETHESWILVRANRVSASPPGRRLFDSEISHQHFIRVTASRCSRERDLKHDWHHAEDVLIEFDMSEAQWGAFVSSFGNGTGVPATLNWFDGASIPDPIDADSRLAATQAEVRNASQEAIEKVQAAQQAVQDAFERGAGKREMRELLRTLQGVTGNLPANMEYAANTMTEHMEGVTVKMRADIEAMIVNAQQVGLAIEAERMPEITAG